jgi:flagellar hook-basal body complex protein FliE
MTVTPAAATQAYAAAMRAASAATERAATTQTASEAGGFGELLQQALESVNQTADRAAQATVAQVTASPRADLVDVVTAVAETELAVQTLVSVRDRVIAAYQEVMRMPI